MGFWDVLKQVGAVAGDIAGSYIGDPALGHQVLGGINAITGGNQQPSSILDTASAVGQSMGAAETGRAKARIDEATMQQAQDRLNLERFQDQLVANAGENQFDLSSFNAQQGAANAQNIFGLGRVNAGVNLADADLARRKFALEAPGKRAGTAVRGDILANAQDFAYGAPTMVGNIPVPTSSGGLRPSIFSDATRQLGSEISKGALASQQAGDVFAPLPGLPDYVAGPKAPSYVAPPAAPGLTPLPESTGLDTALSTGGIIGNASKLLSTLPYFKKKPDVPPPYTEPSDEAGWG